MALVKSHLFRPTVRSTWKSCAVVPAQLTARSLPNSEDPGSNPVLLNIYLLFIVCRKDEKEVEAVNGPFKKTILCKIPGKINTKLNGQPTISLDFVIRFKDYTYLVGLQIALANSIQILSGIDTVNLFCNT